MFFKNYKRLLWLLAFVLCICITFLLSKEKHIVVPTTVQNVYNNELNSEWTQIQNKLGNVDDTFVSSFRLTYKPNGELIDLDFSFYDESSSSLYRLEKNADNSYSLSKSPSGVSDYTTLLRVSDFMYVVNSNLIKNITPKNKTDYYSLYFNPNLQHFDRNYPVNPVYVISNDQATQKLEEGNGFLMNLYSMNKFSNGGAGTSDRFYLIRRK